MSEVVGAIAVVASVIYLGVQIKDNTEATKLAASRTLSESYNTFLDLLTASSDVSDIFLRGLRDYDSLEPVETIRFSALLGRVVRMYEQVFLHERTDQFDAELSSSMSFTLKEHLKYPGFQQWWRIRQDWYHPDFQSYIDELISESGAPLLYEDSRHTPDVE